MHLSITSISGFRALRIFMPFIFSFKSVKGVEGEKEGKASGFILFFFQFFFPGLYIYFLGFTDLAHPLPSGTAGKPLGS